MDIKPRKRYGQHFLKARWVARLFAEWACKFKILLEVGVGGGFITSTVLSHCKNIIVGVEIDERLIDVLASIQFYHVGFAGVIGDAIEYPFRLSGFDAVYGSIPYNITGPLLSMLAIEFQKPALLLLQREVAERLAAKPGSTGYGRITVIVKLVYDVKLGRIVPPSAFKPRPRVYSRIVELKPKQTTYSIEFMRRIEAVTRCMFSQRNRKAVKVAEKCCGANARNIVKEYGENVRVYELPPEAFAKIATHCAPPLSQAS